MDPLDNENPGSTLEEESKPMLMSSFAIASGDDYADKKKSVSLWPRNYSGRRRFVIAGLCFLFAVAVFIKKSGKKSIVIENVVFARSCFWFVHSSFFPHELFPLVMVLAIFFVSLVVVVAAAGLQSERYHYFRSICTRILL